MNKRSLSSRPLASKDHRVWIDSLLNRPKRRRRAWTFEQLEARYYFTAAPAAGLENLQWSYVSNDTPEGQQLIDAIEQMWALQSSSNGAPTIGAVRSGPPTDPAFTNQWHLFNVGQVANFGQGEIFQDLFGIPGEDINVIPAWNSGITGAGVYVAVVDTGVEMTHPDLAANISTQYAYNALTGTSDANPSGNTADAAHGTAVAGLIGAVANNGIGGVGVAYGSTIVPIKFLGAGTTEQAFINAIAANGAPIDVFNHSWGPEDAGTSPTANRGVDALTVPQLIALTNSARLGRNGLGAIHVFAAGNGADAWDSAGSDGYVNSRYTIAVGIVDHDGTIANADGTETVYGEMAPSVLVVAPSASGPIDIIHDFNSGSGLFTTDLTGALVPGQNAGLNRPGGFDGDPYPDDDYTTRFGGTSGAAPLVSGVIALMLEANPNLTYRDVEEILVRSARQNDDDDQSWIVNGIPLFRDPLPHDPGDPNYEEEGNYPDDEEDWNDEILYQLIQGVGEEESTIVRAPGYENYHPIGNPLTQPAPLSLFTNDAGYTVSYGRNPVNASEYGYAHGVVDAALAVELARQWTVKNQTLPPEKTFLVSTLARVPIKAAAVTSDENGRYLIPGGLSNAEPIDFLPYFEEFFKEPAVLAGEEETDPDTIDPNSLPFRGDDPPVNTRGVPLTFTMPVVDPVTGGPNQMSIEWVEVQLQLSGDPTAMNNLRVTLVSPDGTQSELTQNHFRGEDTNKSFQSNPVNLFVDPPGSITPVDENGTNSDTFTWVYSSNRDWGTLAEGTWQLVFENYSQTELIHERSSIVFHGSPVGSPAAFVGRVSGNVGVDSGRFDPTSGNTNGDRDHDFNFNRYLAYLDPTPVNQVLSALRFEGAPLTYSQAELFLVRTNPNGDSVEGRAADPFQEKFASNVTVVAMIDNPGGLNHGQIVDQFITGADGNFYFDLPEGNYTFRVEDPLGRQALNGQTSFYHGAEAFHTEWHVHVDGFFDRVSDVNFLLDPGDIPINEVIFEGQVSGDLDGDGNHDPQDAGVSDFRVFADLNHTGQFEIGEPFAVTDAYGNYELHVDSGTPNTFSIGVSPLTGWTVTSPSLLEGGVHNEYAVPGDTVDGIDFLVTPPSAPSGVGNGIVFGHIYSDVDGDGEQDPSEVGLPNRLVFIDADSDGKYDEGIERSTLTNADGSYQFGDVSLGTHRIDVVVKDPYVLTSPAAGFISVTLVAGQVSQHNDFGIRNLAIDDYGDLVGAGFQSSSAHSYLVPGFSLGGSVDAEVRPGYLVADPSSPDPDHPTYMEDPALHGIGDDQTINEASFDDEDGVVLVGGQLRRGANLIDVIVSGVGGYLQGWIDFNNDGDFDANEKVFDNLDLNPGLHHLVVNAPQSLQDGQVAARFRWGTFGQSFTGTDTIGEIEDYLFTAKTVFAPGDYNGDDLVNDTDYSLWKSTFGSTTDLRADGNHNGIIDASDYTVWRNYASTGGGSGSGNNGGGAGVVVDAPAAPAPSSTNGAAAALAAQASLADYLAQQANASAVSPQVAAYYAARGAVPYTFNGPYGPETRWAIPRSGGSVANTSAPSAGPSGGSAAAQQLPAPEVSLAVDFTGLQFSTTVSLTASTAGETGAASVAADSVDSAMLLLAIADDGDSQTDDGTSDVSADRHEEVDESAFELALASAFGEEGDWWISL